MFNYMIVVNDNGELKSVSPEDFPDGADATYFLEDLERRLNKVLDDRSAREADELGRFGVKTTPRT